MAGCFREVVRTFEIQVPRMTTPEAEAIVLGALRTFDSNVLIRAEANVTDRVVRVTYNSERAARRNFERAIVLAGFEANDLPADPAARERLPAELR